jgi:hypothetical protein
MSTHILARDFPDRDPSTDRFWGFVAGLAGFGRACAGGSGTAAGPEAGSGREAGLVDRRHAARGDGGKTAGAIADASTCPSRSGNANRL